MAGAELGAALPGAEVLEAAGLEAAVPGAEVVATAGLEAAGLEAAVAGAGVLADGVVGVELPAGEPGLLGEQPATARMAAQAEPASAKERREKVIMPL